MMKFILLSHLLSLANIQSFHYEIPDDGEWNAIIIGDSQARGRGFGGALEDRLEEYGFSVDRYCMPGWSTRSIRRFLVGQISYASYPDGIDQDNLQHIEYAFVMSGGNDSVNMLEDASGIISYLKENGVDKVFYMGPPDPTIIGSRNAAIANYPNLFDEENFTNTHWFDIDRHVRRTSYRSQINFNTYINGGYPLDFMYLSELFDYNIPRYSDGIHVSYEAGYQFASMVIY
jgi:hypothetical protein